MPSLRSVAPLRRAPFAAVLALVAAPVLWAGSEDALLNKLVEKGILTGDEAKTLRAEADKDFTTAYAAKSGLPDWLSSLKRKGDLRFRAEQDDPVRLDHRVERERRAGFALAPGAVAAVHIHRRGLPAVAHVAAIAAALQGKRASHASGRRRAGRQVGVAAFAVGAQLEHGDPPEVGAGTDSTVSRQQDQSDSVG